MPNLARDHRTAIVTGASRRAGIGAAICRALASDGLNIFFTHWRTYDRTMPWGADEDGPEALAAELRALGVTAAHTEVDLSPGHAAAVVLDAAIAAIGSPAVLVNNAAHWVAGDHCTLDADVLDAHYAVNVRATVLLSIGFARQYAGGPGGRIINLTSGQSRRPMPNELAYATTKGSIEAFTMTLAAEVAARGITVNAVDPGPTDTGWISDREALARRFPSNRIGTPADAARLVAFLASRAADGITGQVLHADGGFA